MGQPLDASPSNSRIWGELGLEGMERMSDFTHIDDTGAARMVDVGGKEPSQRYARATSTVSMSRETAACILQQNVEKGDVLQVARLIDAVTLSLDFVDSSSLVIQAEVRTTARTGVEMEALMAASVAALAVYDMCKSLDRQMLVEKVQLEEKTGGRSGHFHRD